MAVVIETPNSPRTRKQANFEKAGWLFMRVSGPLLLVLIVTHLMTNLVLGDGIKAINFAFVAGKWADPLWQWWDLSMLWLAMIHGTNGMRTIVNDYAERVKVRQALNFSLWGVCATLITLGTLVIFTFDPCIDPNAVNYLSEICSAN